MKGLLNKPYLVIALWLVGISMSPGQHIIRPTTGMTPRATVWRPQPRDGNPPSPRNWLVPDPMGLEATSTPTHPPKPFSGHPRHIA